MDENMPIAMEYFKDNGWTQQHVKEMKFSKNTRTYENKVYLGMEFNTIGECINCKGVRINVDNGFVIIANFDEDGDRTRPYMQMTTSVGTYRPKEKDTFQIFL